MSAPECKCRSEYGGNGASWAQVVLCPLHTQAVELYEIVDSLVSQTEQKVRHGSKCRCLHCRSVRALRKARGL